MRTRYLAEHIDWLRENYPQYGIPELTERFNDRFGLNKSRQQIQYAIRNHRITCGRKTGELNKGRTKCSAEQLDWLRENYRVMSREELWQEYRVLFDPTMSRGALLGALKRFGILSGRDGRFEKGNAPWNAGTRGVMKPNSGSFQPGQMPHTHAPIGTETVGKGGYLKRKVADVTPSRRGWKFVHHLLWEEHHGPIPTGHAIVFVDGDKTNIVIENLAMVSRGELAALNKRRMLNLPAEVVPTAIASVRLELKANQVGRKKTSEELRT